MYVVRKSCASTRFEYFSIELFSLPFLFFLEQIKNANGTSQQIRIGGSQLISGTGQTAVSANTSNNSNAIRKVQLVQLKNKNIVVPTGSANRIVLKGTTLLTPGTVAKSEFNTQLHIKCQTYHKFIFPFSSISSSYSHFRWNNDTNVNSIASPTNGPDNINDKQIECQC